MQYLPHRGGYCFFFYLLFFRCFGRKSFDKIPERTAQHISKEVHLTDSFMCQGKMPLSVWEPLFSFYLLFPCGISLRLVAVFFPYKKDLGRLRMLCFFSFSVRLNLGIFLFCCASSPFLAAGLCFLSMQFCTGSFFMFLWLCFGFAFLSAPFPSCCVCFCSCRCFPRFSAYSLPNLCGSKKERLLKSEKPLFVVFDKPLSVTQLACSTDSDKGAL